MIEIVAGVLMNTHIFHGEWVHWDGGDFIVISAVAFNLDVCYFYLL